MDSFILIFFQSDGTDTVVGANQMSAQEAESQKTLRRL